MIIIDTALIQRQSKNNPLRIGIIGAGSMGQGTVLTIETAIPGMEVGAIYNRGLAKARKAFDQAGVTNYIEVKDLAEADLAMGDGKRVISSDPKIVCRMKALDVIIEITGEVEFGAKVTLDAIRHKKHVVLLNAELDATIGPILKVHADQQGVILTNADGDQPGVLMNLFRFVTTIGYRPVLAGNIKGMLDHHLTPKTQKAWAEKHNQNPFMVTSFADGTKLAMEMAVVANATGFRTGQRGMAGPACKSVQEALDLFPLEDLLNGGRVDYILGAEPGPGVFIIGYNNNPALKPYMPVFKMGDGPYYLFYVPYHLPHLEVPLTAARAALFNDAAITPQHGPVCEVVTLAKKRLKKGTRLDGIGGFTCYGTLENTDVSYRENLLPMGLSKDCILLRNVAKDQPITLDHVEMPAKRLSHRLWKEQMNYFNLENNAGEPS
ncbi:MAG: hypothetical protein JJT75_06660 [Opitutales bacterium]|nr:hypothetical protein [Opitutales bacterium]MCH8541427.1 hypothetical protein [Opitutales bacterium]